MADERSTSLNQGFGKWLQVTDTDQLETWNGTDKMPALKESLGINDKASLSAGTWSPLYKAVSGEFDEITMEIIFAEFVKIGSVCHLSAVIRTTSISQGTASGELRISGLPFTSKGASALSVADVAVFGGWTSRPEGLSTSSDTAIRLNAGGSRLSASDLAYGTGNRNYLVIGGAYII